MKEYLISKYLVVVHSIPCHSVIIRLSPDKFKRGRNFGTFPVEICISIKIPYGCEHILLEFFQYVLEKMDCTTEKRHSHLTVTV